MKQSRIIQRPDEQSPEITPTGSPPVVHAIPMHLSTWQRWLISPEQAAVWLQRSRPGNEIRLRSERLCREIREGRWQYNGAPIIFGTDGLLLDGHNRLDAVMKTGISIECDVSFGRPVTGWYTLDIGDGRQPAHAPSAAAGAVAGAAAVAGAGTEAGGVSF